MKQKFLAIVVAAVFAACNSNPKTSTQPASAAISDTGRNSAAADRGQVIELKGVNDTIVTGDGSRYVKVDTSNSSQTVVKSETPVRTQRETVHHTARHTSSGSSSGSGSSNGGYSSTSGTGTSTAESTPVPAKKKGWSKAAKGTVIGAGTGAIAGALISKKKGLGAVIGGVVGGAGGYIIGHSKDKKDGRN